MANLEYSVIPCIMIDSLCVITRFMFGNTNKLADFSTRYTSIFQGPGQFALLDDSSIDRKYHKKDKKSNCLPQHIVHLIYLLHTRNEY